MPLSKEARHKPKLRYISLMLQGHCNESDEYHLNLKHPNHISLSDLVSTVFAPRNHNQTCVFHACGVK